MNEIIDLSIITNGLAAMNRIPFTNMPDQQTALDDAAKRWVDAGFSPLAARVWIEAGAETPDLAIAFERALLTPDVAKAALGTAKDKWEFAPLPTKALDAEKAIAADIAARLALTAPFRVVSMTPGEAREHYGVGASRWNVIDARGALVHTSASVIATTNIADEANSLRGVHFTQKDIKEIRESARRIEPERTNYCDFADVLSDHIEKADEIAHAPGDDENPTGYIFREKTVDELANRAREAGNVQVSDFHAYRGNGFIVLDQNEAWIREIDYAERVKFNPDTFQIVVDPTGPTDERTFVGRISDIRFGDQGDSFVIDSPNGKLRIGYDQSDLVGFEDVVEDGATLAVTYGRNGKVVVEWERTAATDLLNDLKEEIPGFEIVRRDLEANRRYSGRIYGITADEVFQEVGRGKIRPHDRSTIEGYIGVSGDLVRIEYDNKMIGHVEPLERERFRQPSKDTTEVDR